MPKKITSPVTRFPGSVTLLDPIPLSACVAWEAALADCQPAPCSDGQKILMQLWREPEKSRDEVALEYTEHFTACKNCRPGLSDTAAQERMIKAIRACVEAWDIPAFDLANPPGSPRVARSKFVAWLITEIGIIYNEAEADGDPNALQPEPTPTA